MVEAYKVERSYTNGGRSSCYYNGYDEALENFKRGDRYLSDTCLKKIVAESLADFLNNKYQSQDLQSRSIPDGY